MTFDGRRCDPSRSGRGRTCRPRRRTFTRRRRGRSGGWERCAGAPRSSTPRRRPRRTDRPPISSASGRHVGSAPFRRRGSRSRRERSCRRPSRSSPSPAARRLRTHCVCLRGATRYLLPPNVKTLTGVRRGSPVFRPRTSRMREPQTLSPPCVSAATTLLKTFRVNQSGRMYRCVTPISLVPSASTTAVSGTHSCAPLTRVDQRSDLNAARSSSEKSRGCSQAAKWPPFSTSLK
jgi:hypothetical protein